MRLRRLEFIVIGVTLAFACFTGGFFTGRSWSSINIVSVAAQADETQGIAVYPNKPDTLQQENTKSDTLPPPSGSDDSQIQPNEQKPSVPADTAGQPKGGDGKININLATQSELTDLPGIGNVLASRIVDYRRQHGDFQKIEDIRNVSGIGEKRYEAIQDKITAG